ncbi:type II toxin-antitoxin system RelE/ParE family toxin [uncultured Parolsenella sp.]|uniref:type II toxin-antitoxin system RelE/ParE family toxin n=1 Tax=uncultured Parolsenella sp. TaxID=2083008 RepID=UPI0035A83644
MQRHCSAYFSKAVDELETFPENRPINRDASKGLGFAVRRIPVGNYGLFYYVDRPAARVQAFSFLHSRQDVGAHIRSDYQGIS